MSHKCFQHTRENTKSREIYIGVTQLFICCLASVSCTQRKKHKKVLSAEAVFVTRPWEAVFILIDLMSRSVLCLCAGVTTFDSLTNNGHNYIIRLGGCLEDGNTSREAKHTERKSRMLKTRKVSESKSSVLACRRRDKIKMLKIVHGGREKLVPLLTFDQVWWRSGPKNCREKHETDIKTRLKFSQ